MRKQTEVQTELKLKKLLQHMLWEEVMLERGQNAEFSSKPEPSKYNLKDTFFRKAFMKKPEVSEATA